MSKKQPSPIEDRWRWHSRRMRTLANLHNERSIGDPLGIVAAAQRSGSLVGLEMVVQDEAEFFAQQAGDRRLTAAARRRPAGCRLALREIGETPLELG
jgi:hypothetical protein